MKLQEAVKKSTIVRRASNPQKVFDMSGDQAIKGLNEIADLTLEELTAEDWCAKITVEKWIGSREPKESPKK